MTPCAEHEATLALALERVKRLEEALRAIADACEAQDDENACDIQCHILARAALRPEGT